MKYLTLLLTLIAFSVNAQKFQINAPDTTRPMIISGGYISNPLPVEMPYYTAASFKVDSITSYHPIVMYDSIESDTVKAMVLECTWGSNEVRPVSLYRIRKTIGGNSFFTMRYNSTSYYYNMDFSPYLPPKNTFLFLPDNK